MKVYVVMAFAAESYNDTTWVDSVWTSQDQAVQYVTDNPGRLEADVNDPDDDDGYFLSTYITEHEVK